MADTSSAPTLIDGNVTLRRPRAGDVEARIAAGNSAEIHHMFGGDPQSCPPVSEKQARAWVDDHTARDHSWFIDVDDVLSGVVFLHSLNQADQRATLSIGLLRAAQLGQGTGTRALHLLAGHAFGAMRLHRIALRVIEYNARAIAAYKKVGFVEEGRERESARVSGQWYDDVMMGLLAEDYARLRAAS